MICSYDSDTNVTLKQGQGHQTWYELVDPKQGTNHAKFGRSALNSLHKNQTLLKLLSNQKTCQLSPLNMWASKK